MFGSSKNTEDSSKNTSSSSSSATGGINTLVKGTTVEGTLRCDSDIRVDGTIKGKLICKSKVILGPTGHIEGEINCQNAVIEGKFKGILTVKDLLNVRDTADIDGDISTGKLVVQSGAKFNVACKMDNGTGSTNGASKNADTKANDSSKIATGKAATGN
jgi:cytoskeletal protein CcmA (bactofilin family)